MAGKEGSSCQSRLTLRSQVKEGHREEKQRGAEAKGEKGNLHEWQGIIGDVEAGKQQQGGKRFGRMNAEEE